MDKLINFIKSLREKILSEEKTVLLEREKDISLSTDKLLNNEIIEYLKENFDFPILSEELHDQKDYLDFEGYYWIIDPLDGTLNHSRGVPLTCISVSLWNNDNPVIGLIYDFQRDELFYGVCDENSFNEQPGAWLNGNILTVSNISDACNGIICTGFPSWRNYGDESLMDFTKKVKEWKKVRLLGSAALSLAWLGAGRVDAYIEEDIRIWDISAGMAIVKAAGGSIYVKKNNKDNFVTAIATNGKINVEELL